MRQGGFRTRGTEKIYKNNQPIISIITVVYNGELTLEDTILSVLNQRYQNIEYIIIDGDSTDQTLKIINKYDDMLDYWISEPDEGVYHAMNKGISLASGDYIGLINSGDLYQINTCTIVAKEMMLNKSDVYYGMVRVCQQDDTLLCIKGNTIDNIANEMIGLEINRKDGGLRLKGVLKKFTCDRPVISIITVVYNAGAQLENTIKSVINQAYDNIEFIIIDGGSTDNSVEIIKKYEDYIDYWESVADAGIYDAMNKGWTHANDNSRVLFLGAGDMILSLPVETIIKNQLSNSILYGMVDLGECLFSSVASWKLHLGNTLHHQALLIPKKLHLSPPFNTSYTVFADYDFNARLYKQNCHFEYVKDFKSFALPDGVSSKSGFTEMIKISRENFGSIWALLSFFYLAYQRRKGVRQGRAHK